MFLKRLICCLICLAFILTSCDKKTVTDKNNNSTDNVAATTKKGEKTYTGYPKLEIVNFEVKDKENVANIPTEKIAHSYGVAKNSEPHNIAVESQLFFEEKGYSAITYDNKSNGKVLYLTFDCGYENGYTSKVLDILKEKGVKAAFFCTLDDIKSEPELIARMIKEGHIVGNHSATHPSFTEISREKMANEIEECENYLRQNFGYSSRYFRFPKGEYSESALELVGSFGYISVFWSLSYADWDTSSQKGADYAFKKVTSRLHPGAIILLHSVSADNAGALGRIIDYALKEGYHFSAISELDLSYSK